MTNWQAIDGATLEVGTMYLVQCEVQDAYDNDTFIDWFVCTYDEGELVADSHVFGASGTTIKGTYIYTPTHVAEIVEAEAK